MMKKMSPIMINRFLHNFFFRAILLLLSAHPVTPLISSAQPNATPSAAPNPSPTDILVDIANKMKEGGVSLTKDHIDSAILFLIDDTTKDSWKKTNVLLKKLSDKLKDPAFPDLEPDHQNCDKLECQWVNLSLQISMASVQTGATNIPDTTVFHTLKNWAQIRRVRALFDSKKTNDAIETITKSLHTMNMEALKANLGFSNTASHVKACFFKYLLNKQFIGGINTVFSSQRDIQSQEAILDQHKKTMKGINKWYDLVNEFRKIEQMSTERSSLNSRYSSGSVTKDRQTDDDMKKEHHKERAARRWIRQKSKENKRRKRQRRGTNPRKTRRHKKSRRQEA